MQTGRTVAVHSARVSGKEIKNVVVLVVQVVQAGYIPQTSTQSCWTTASPCLRALGGWQGCYYATKVKMNSTSCLVPNTRVGHSLDTLLTCEVH